jgi:hypothetical protein
MKCNKKNWKPKQARITKRKLDYRAALSANQPWLQKSLDGLPSSICFFSLIFSFHFRFTSVFVEGPFTFRSSLAFGHVCYFIFLANKVANVFYFCFNVSCQRLTCVTSFLVNKVANDKFVVSLFLVNKIVNF